VTFGTIFRFQFGTAAAIRAVAENRNSIFVGIILVLLTAIARNYDQMHFTESAMWLAGPLVFSLFSGTFLFGILYLVFIRRHLADRAAVSFWRQWIGFMGLFWMTAPVAWLYAIPSERLFDPYAATVANLVLLSIVSIWRVLLMSRVVSVLQELPFFRALGWVALPALLEVVLVIFVGGLFSPTFSQKILAGMGGMRNSPEENLLLAALGNVLLGAAILLVLLVMVLGAKRFDGTVKSFPAQSARSIPYLALVTLAAVWIAIAIPPQREQSRFLTHARFIKNKEYRRSLDYLGTRTPDDFPPSRRLEPNPYEYRAWKQLPKIVAELRPNEPQWVKDLYLGYVETLFTHRMLSGDAVDWAKMLENVARLPEGKEWGERNRAELSSDQFESLRSETTGVADQKRLDEALERLTPRR
jgi:hypothetical protein